MRFFGRQALSGRVGESGARMDPLSRSQDQPESLATGSRLHPKGDPVWMEDSAGGMPTGATGKLEQQTAGPLNGLVALPRKSLMIGGKKKREELGVTRAGRGVYWVTFR
jgi:hypothetical protein